MEHRDQPYILVTLGSSFSSSSFDILRKNPIWKSMVQKKTRAWGCPESAMLAVSGQLQFWSEPSEILNLRSSNTPETVAFTIPWYWWFSVTRFEYNEA